jgi:hypothetical protein
MQPAKRPRRRPYIRNIPWGAGIVVLAALNHGGCSPDALPFVANSQGVWNEEASNTVVAGQTETVTDTIIADPPALDFGVQVSELSLRLSSAGGGDTPFQVRTNAPWVTTSPAGGTIGSEPVPIRVRIDRSALLPETRSTVLTITSPIAATVEVLIRVDVSGTRTAGALRTDVGALEFSDEQSALPLQITNTGDATVGFVISPGSIWLSTDPSSGTLAPQENRTILVQVDRTQLSDGDRASFLLIGGDDGGLSRIDVTVGVAGSSGGQPVLYVSHSALDFGSTTRSRAFLVRNQGAGTLTFDCRADASWISLEGGSGTSDGEYKVVQVLVDRTGLSPGDYSAAITIVSDGGESTIAVTLRVDTGGDGSSGESALYVNPGAMDFGSTSSNRPFLLRNTGPGTLNFTVESKVSWAAVSPTSGSNNGRYDVISVSVDRTGLSTGSHVGTIEVRGDNGETKSVSLTVNVPDGNQSGDPLLESSTEVLYFGLELGALAFTLRNGSGGQISYRVEAGAEWVQVQPGSGDLTTEEDTVQVTVDRTQLYSGPYETELRIYSNGVPDKRIVISAEEPEISPKPVPWIELNSVGDDEALESAVTGLKVWQRVTDTAIVSTIPGKAEIYSRLRERLPELNIIPGIKTSERLGTDDFDNVDAWKLIASDVSEVAEAAGQDRVILESESALLGYFDGEWSIDFDQLAIGLAYLPPDIEILWYPSIVSKGQEREDRSAAVCELVEEVCSVQFVDLGWDAPDSPDSPLRKAARERLDRIADNVTLPITYFGTLSGYEYWRYDQIFEVMDYLSHPEMIIYPGDAYWIDAADAITDKLYQGRD